jgi:hypothetical protein
MGSVGRLTLDLRRNDLDGTNIASERLIGWQIKKRTAPCEDTNGTSRSVTWSH